MIKNKILIISYPWHFIPIRLKITLDFLFCQVQKLVFIKLFLCIIKYRCQNFYKKTKDLFLNQNHNSNQKPFLLLSLSATSVICMLLIRLSAPVGICSGNSKPYSSWECLKHMTDPDDADYFLCEICGDYDLLRNGRMIFSTNMKSSCQFRPKP